MQTYIDAENLKEEINSLKVTVSGENVFGKDAKLSILYVIDTQATIDAVKVVHSRWMQVDNTQEHYCEDCGTSFNLYAYCKNDYKYCPGCGAKMDKT